MNAGNPFTITFGKQPNKLISRIEDTDSIISAFKADNAVSQAYMIEGIRGSGKTVLMTTVANILKQEKDWIVVDLNPAMELLANFAVRLSKASDPSHDIVSKGINLSAAGFGIGINAEAQTNDYVGMIDKCFKSIVRKKKKVLITIDEVMHDDNMKVFASQFQIFVRQDYPVYLIMTGLYENISAIQNDPALTFLLRTPKIITGPLSILQITRQYRDIFDIPEEEAAGLADLTKGYAFAFQALGVAYWNNRSKSKEAVLNEFDVLLDDFVYKKIWSSLSRKEKEVLRALPEKDVRTGEVCKRLSMSSGTFSRYRDNLIQKGIISSPDYGYVSFALPRLYEVIKSYR
ncbi:MAG: ATP-binding protein [Lachnospiraceae bacterium]|nr:ATP-binding protein [Lachnospiraceae bacterium]